jgi:hypothetical protein
LSIADLQLFLRHDNQKTTEIYAGYLASGTQVQADVLDRFWTEQLQGSILLLQVENEIVYKSSTKRKKGSTQCELTP